MISILMVAAIGLITAGYCTAHLATERQAAQAFTWAGSIVLVLTVAPALWHAIIGRVIGAVRNRERSPAHRTAMRVGLSLAAVVINGLAVWVNQGYGRSRHEGLVPISTYLRLAVAGALIQIAILTFAQLRRTGGPHSWQCDRNP